jgi:hypothetical protein
MAATISQYKGITLEEWEAKTKLTELQRQSVLELQDACAELPLPEGVRSNLINKTLMINLNTDFF